MYFPKYRNIDTGNFSLTLSIYKYKYLVVKQGAELKLAYVMQTIQLAILHNM